jgi:hypothetical protein
VSPDAPATIAVVAAADAVVVLAVASERRLRRTDAVR